MGLAQVTKNRYVLVWGLPGCPSRFLVARGQITQSSTEDKAVVTAVTQLITDPMVTRFIVLIVLGVITGAVGFVMNRKVTAPVS